MAEYTNNDINDARRRVEEMRQKAKHYVDSPTENESRNTNADESSQRKVQSSSDFGFLGDIFSSLFSSNEDDNSTPLLLALILILTKEGADSKLILALLYILL